MAVRSELSWTHYRMLLKVEKEIPREFYMKEAITGKWSTRQLVRQINSLYFDRLHMSKDMKGLMLGNGFSFEDQLKQPGDNPTIGLILCAEKNRTIVKYSLLSESKQIFAIKYQFYLPSTKQLEQEIQREREQIEQEKNLSGK